MTPDILASIRVDVTAHNGSSINERGQERLAEAIESALYDNDLQHAIYEELAKRLPADLVYELEIRAKEIPTRA